MLEQHLAHRRGPGKQEPGWATFGDGAPSPRCLGLDQHLVKASSSFRIPFDGLPSSWAVCLS